MCVCVCVATVQLWSRGDRCARAGMRRIEQQPEFCSDENALPCDRCVSGADVCPRVSTSIKFYGHEAGDGGVCGVKSNDAAMYGARRVCGSE